MKRATILTAVAGGLVTLAVVGGFLALDRRTLHWYADDGGSAFCVDVETWHSGQAGFFRRTHQEGFSSHSGLPVTFDLFSNSAKAVPYKARTAGERQLQDSLLSIIRAEDEWLSKLVTLDLIDHATGRFTSQEFLDAHGEAEVSRVAMNAALRGSSALLDQVCDLPPVPYYS